ncbi:MAG: cytochrome C peroxidase [Deltaproteobacteria bacterium]|nr:MAG: cytochrome C peroxidase [Deltaproteobacteria bacterium]
MNSNKMKTAVWAVPLALLCAGTSARAAGTTVNLTAPDSLKTLKVPEPAALMTIVKDRKAAITLGKALFWDMQVGSDGVQACASCHFHAGADSRSKNEVNPGGDNAFQLVPGPNSTVAGANFPFHRLADRDDRLSSILADSSDVMGSQGVFQGDFVGFIRGLAEEIGNTSPDAVFHVGANNTRRVTGRQAPSVINAAFNYNNFWDGRANFIFNGNNPFGDSDVNARVFSDDGTGALKAVAVHLENSSLASQAVGPPGSGTEMSLNNRTFPDIGKKLLSLRPLGKQMVHASDSVLGTLVRKNARWTRPGLDTTYTEMVKAAFRSQYWNVNSQVVSFDAGGAHLVSRPAANLASNQYTQMEANFSLFFGLAVQMYEDTLISDDSPFDRFQEGDTSALSRSAQEGLNLFLTPADPAFAGGSCFNCHFGPEFSKATVSNVGRVNFTGDLPEQIIERMDMNDGHGATYDSGFYNIGVRPTEEDLGRGGADPFGYPLSFTARALMLQNGTKLPFPNPANICGDGKTQPCPMNRVAIDGTFKTPSLRNVELTGPYFHNGGQATLMQVVDFYTRGGDFHEHNIANLDSDIDRIDGMNEVGKQHIVDFLLSLTDERVRWEKAPFDHPELLVPNGSPGDSASVSCGTASTCRLRSGGAHLQPERLCNRRRKGVPGADGRRARLEEG